GAQLLETHARVAAADPEPRRDLRQREGRGGADQKRAHARGRGVEAEQRGQAAPGGDESIERSVAVGSHRFVNLEYSEQNATYSICLYFYTKRSATWAIASGDRSFHGGTGASSTGSTRAVSANSCAPFAAAAASRRSVGNRSRKFGARRKFTCRSQNARSRSAVACATRRTGSNSAFAPRGFAIASSARIAVWRVPIRPASIASHA